jgi:hypothetical protein
MVSSCAAAANDLQIYMHATGLSPALNTACSYRPVSGSPATTLSSSGKRQACSAICGLHVGSAVRGSSLTRLSMQLHAPELSPGSARSAQNRRPMGKHRASTPSSRHPCWASPADKLGKRCCCLLKLNTPLTRALDLRPKRPAGAARYSPAPGCR